MKARYFTRRSAAVAAGVIVSASIVACATADDPSGGAISVASDASADAAFLSPNDGDAAERHDATVADAAMPCSSDGWCKTTLPGTDIVVHDVVPFEKRAFALMDGNNILIKVGEWTPEGGWNLLQGSPQWTSAGLPGRLWAPDEDTVYYTLVDLAGFYGGSFGIWVVRGRRPVAPATQWTWTKGRVPCDRATPGAGIGGTKDGDVYVATCGKIYRLDTAADAGAAADGGAETLQWIDEGFVDVDQALPIDFYDIGGTGPDDLWFAGGRLRNGLLWYGQSPCAILLHKSADGYRTVLDGIPLASGCSPRGDLPMVPGSLSQGISTPSKNRVLATTEATTALTQEVSGENILLNVGLSGDQVTVATTRPPQTMTTAVLGSIWGTSPDDLLVVASYDLNFTNARSALIRGKWVWGDNPSYGYSRLAINGTPNLRPLYRVRGTSNENLWAVGMYNAYHKSTP